VTVPVRRGGRVVEEPLEGFLRSTGTGAFLAVKGDTLVSEVYFHGYGHDATVSSFSVAKPVVSALVGIAIAQGRIGSVDDPVTRYLPELARRDPRFGRITLRHLLRRLLGSGQPRPVHLRRPQPRPGPGPLRDRLQLRPLARAPGRAGPPPLRWPARAGRLAPAEV
jgi:CubicO group peptidase (beta-lactamase class C family)